MSDVIIREGFLAGSRSRSCDENKVPTGEWSDWRWRSANGSGYFSYLYSGPGKAKQSLRRIGTHYTPIYDNSNRPKQPEDIYYTKQPPWNSPESKVFQEKVEAYRNKLREWSDNRPIVGYNETEYKAVPAKMVADEEDLK